MLASAGGPDALAAVKAAVQDKDEPVQDEAVRTLSTWPNNWPEDSGVAEPLLALARSDAKTSHQVLALRGYLQYVQANKQLKDDDKVGKVADVLPLIKRPEEKRLAIAAIGTVPNARALEMLVTFAAEPALPRTPAPRSSSSPSRPCRRFPRTNGRRRSRRWSRNRRATRRRNKPANCSRQPDKDTPTREGERPRKP